LGDLLEVNFISDFVSTYSQHYAGLPQAQADQYPRVITEIGINNADDVTQGKNLLTGLLNAWQDNYSMYMIYQLYNVDGWGIFTGYGSPKPCATYFHNFWAAIGDTSSNALTFSPGSLAFTLSGMPSTAESSLFQKSDGSFQIVLWNNVRNWDLQNGVSIGIGATGVTVTLGNSATIQVYDPTSGSSPITTLSSNSVTVSLFDYPLVININ